VALVLALGVIAVSAIVAAMAGRRTVLGNRMDRSFEASKANSPARRRQASLPEVVPDGRRGREPVPRAS
jgi:hypothetical protein